ncbi:MAG: shikimate dehydrogenase [Roseburia sp.]
MGNEITGATGLTCLLGHPVAHSISPQMHNEAFRLLGLDYRYLAFDVTPETLERAFTGLKALNVLGFNLTMPLKTAILPYLDDLTPTARLSNSVNTVYRDGERYIGHMTDGIGYMRSVTDAGFSIIGKKMTLLGAGGAATAILVQAALDGVKEIYVCKRKNASWDKTLALIEQINHETSCKVSLHDIEDSTELAQCISNSDILTNATNVGMAPDIENCPVSPDMLFPELIVSDIIYNPRETKLIQYAKAIGCPTFNGLYMLLYQGAASFKCWTGMEMPIAPIKEKYFSKQ